MNLNEHYSVTRLVEDNLQKKLEKSLNPNIVSHVMSLLNKHKHSELVKYITKKALNPTNSSSQHLVHKKLEQLDAYKLDPMLFKQLMNIKGDGLVPGEILVSLLYGSWGSSDVVNIKGVGNTKIRYVRNITTSTEVTINDIPLYAGSELEKIITGVVRIIKETPDILSRCCSTKEAAFFVDNTVFEVENKKSDISHNSITIIGHILKNGDVIKEPKLLTNRMSLQRYIDTINDIINRSIIGVTNILLLGDKINNGRLLEGMYFLIPTEDIKYYTLSTISHHKNIKVSPFFSEQEFFEETI